MSQDNPNQIATCTDLCITGHSILVFQLIIVFVYDNLPDVQDRKPDS